MEESPWEMAIAGDGNEAKQNADPLAAINDHVRSQGPAASSFCNGVQWLALESNPEVFNPFCERMGLPAGWGFVDVWGLDAETLDLVPQPVAACVVLFPCTDAIYEARRRQDVVLSGKGTDSQFAASTDKELFFLRQVKDFGNACGTIACLHAVANCRHSVSLQDGAPLEGFVRSHLDMSPEERGHALVSEQLLRAASDEAAALPQAQTALPQRDGPPLDHHFAAFVRSAKGQLIELDGTKRVPVDHGPTTERTFLADAAVAMRRHFVDVSPEVHGFAFMALVKFNDE
eukprot:TRINITY_DN22785_c0_g1_i1.p1 TRINITY_DN22785_c0_g1~~TRINITY_DN22785_c0_g1_i1.p1  ORF type:complete len:302 (-),score=57.91 TRINITY_DN22785_c0_g1_i1:40-903(-)